MEDCSVKYALDLLVGKWKLYILYVLLNHQTIRFNKLQREVGNISALMLSRTLSKLEEDGLVERIDYHVVPPHVEYKLTTIGSKLTQALEVLGEWGHEVWVTKQSHKDNSQYGKICEVFLERLGRKRC